jgi:hypothetical protein
MFICTSKNKLPSETNTIPSVLFGMQNRTLGPYLAANNGILISESASFRN